MILICGIPNAGKTTYSAQYDNVVHFDEVLGRHRWDKVIEMVKQDPTLVVEGVYEHKEDRIKLVEASQGANTCIWLDVPVDICVDRENNGRRRSEHLVIWAAEDFEEPSYDEGWDEIKVIRNY